MNDSLLLNYMYQKGYTEEDMYDIHTINKVRGSFGFITYKIKLGMKAFAERIVAAFKRIKEIFTQALTEMAKPNEKTISIPLIIDYGTKIPLRSQVMDNKPRHMVRKIIR